MKYLSIVRPEQGFKDLCMAFFRLVAVPDATGTTPAHRHWASLSSEERQTTTPFKLIGSFADTMNVK